MNFFQIFQFVFLTLLVFFNFDSANTFEGGISKLPELVVYANSSYLVRGVETRLECLIAGQPVEWANATLDRLLWLKDGTPIPDNNNALRIVQASHHSEGEYQCSAIVRQINVAFQHTVNSRLVSAPLKLRRARITKFERYDASSVRVRQGQVARLACHGLPDVIPSPPELWFEKYGHEGLALGKTGNERFIVTTSGLQIALTQPSDAGRYFCIVRNTFTNQTRRAPRPVVLVVEPRIFDSDYNKKSLLHSDETTEFKHPQIVFPEAVNYSEPIEYHVVVGQTTILECVIWEAKVMWNRSDKEMPAVSLTDDRARIRQIWGNLRIKQVTLEDSGEYICYGIPPLVFASSVENINGAVTLSSLDAYSMPKLLRVIYQLIVHAPTNVRLMLAQQVSDKSWQLSCYAHNLRYEIPMVYVNGLALIDAMKEMDVPPQTNFFTNPINVTLRANNPLAGSVQCVSRPAMEEAEVYGSGLERGRAMNLYVDDRLNRHDSTKFNAAATVTLTQIKKEEKEYKSQKNENEFKKVKDEQSVKILRLRAFIAEDHSVRIQWDVEPKNYLKLTQILSFSVEMFWRFSDNQNDEFKSSKSKLSKGWTVIERVQSHVRALTLQKLALKKSGDSFQLRVTANFHDGSLLSSEPTDWLKSPWKKETVVVDEEEIVSKKGEKNNDYSSTEKNDDIEDDEEQVEKSRNRFSILAPPVIIRLQTVSHESMLIAWNHSSSTRSLHDSNSHNFKQIEKQKSNKNLPSLIKFIITYKALDDNYFLAKNRQKINYEKKADNQNNVELNERRTNENKEEEEKHIEVSATSTEILLTELSPDTEYKVNVVAENGAGQRSLPSRSRIGRTYVLIDEIYENKNISNMWWTKLRRDYLNLPDVSLKFELMFGALCIAAIMLIVLCCLTTFRLCEWRRQSGRRHHRHSGSSLDSANQFFMESSSPTFFSPKSSSHRLSKRDRQLYHEPCFFSIKDPISELSPLGCYDHAPSQHEPDNQKKKDFAENNDNTSIYINRNSLMAVLAKNTAENGTGVHLANNIKRPNLYGNPDTQLDKLLDDICNTNKNLRNETVLHNATLKRSSSFQRQQSALIIGNVNTNSTYGNVSFSAFNDCGITVGNSKNIKIKSPSPSALSTSMYGGALSMYNGTMSRRLLMHLSTGQHARNNSELSQYMCTTEAKLTDNCDTYGQQLDHEQIKIYASEMNGNKKKSPHVCKTTQENSVIENDFNTEAANSVYRSRISLSNCGSSNVAYGDCQQTPYEYDCYGCDIFCGRQHCTSSPKYSVATRKYSAASTSAAPGPETMIKQMSTFKSPSAANSASASSGYNSYSGSGIAIAMNTCHNNSDNLQLTELTNDSCVNECSGTSIIGTYNKQNCNNVLTNGDNNNNLTFS